MKRMLMMKVVFKSVLCLTSLIFQTASAESFFGAAGVCYARQYSAEHMTKNPEQTVSYIRFDHFGYDGDEEEFELDSGEVIFDLIVQFKNSHRKFGDTGKCRADGNVLECAIECDGGQFDVKPKGKDSILIYNKYGLRVTECGDDESFREVSSKADDDVFLLHRLPADQCFTESQ